MAGDIPTSVVSGKYVRTVTVAASGPQGDRGPVGPQGPPGPAGVSSNEIVGLVSYTHSQVLPLIHWGPIVHNLNFFPNVTVFNTAGDQVEGSVIHTDETTLTIDFSTAVSGKAHLS
jgi:hypothetical protein